jgi:hypothetical protein
MSISPNRAGTTWGRAPYTTWGRRPSTTWGRRPSTTSWTRQA